jgi:dTDP-4-dehydrorhamnose reductase
MKALITGGSGQLGCELQRSVPKHTECIALDRTQLDIADASAIDRILAEHQPTVIINAAAYTAVDKAEQEQKTAVAANVIGPGLLAQAAAERNLRIIHISTDFVFDGAKSSPYLPADEPSPMSVYGATKLKGERQVLEIAAERAVIVRTGWVYSAHGHNFVKTMLRLMRERDALNVVVDQIGTPTWAYGLAEAVWGFVERPAVSGVFHWSDAGVASWYDFAVAIQEEATDIGLLEKEIPVHPIRTVDYPTPARRPSYSVLDKTATWMTLGAVPLHWRAALRRMLAELKESTC